MVDYSGSEGTDDSSGDERPPPTDEEVEACMKKVVTVRRPRMCKDYEEGKFDGQWLSVEWRASTLVDRNELLRNLLERIGMDASFVLGAEEFESKMQYLVVVRLGSRVDWSDVRERFAFGCGHDGKGVDLDLRVLVRVPCGNDEESITAFMEGMKRRVDTMYVDVVQYGDVYGWLERDE